jgi:hypothetical protein
MFMFALQHRIENWNVIASSELSLPILIGSRIRNKDGTIIKARFAFLDSRRASESSFLELEKLGIRPHSSHSTNNGRRLTCDMQTG